MDINTKNDGIKKRKQRMSEMMENLDQLALKANKVRTAKSRAKIAAQILLQFDTINCRAFDNCFENGEAEKVQSIIVYMAQKDTHLYNCIQKHIPSFLNNSRSPQVSLFNERTFS